MAISTFPRIQRGWSVLFLLCFTAVCLWNIRFLSDSRDEDFYLEGYFVNTSGCRIRAMNPLSYVAKKYMREPKPMKCKLLQILRAETRSGKNYLELAVSEEQILETFKVTSVSDVHCNYTMVARRNDNFNYEKENKTFYFTTNGPVLELEGGQKAVRTMCYGKGYQLFYHDVHFFLPDPAPHHKKFVRKPKRLSVMILGIDSISHMHFSRMMPATAAFVRQRPHVEFWGYKRIGLNSYPNLCALLSGFSEEELELGCYSNKTFFDNCKFLWNHYKEAGYNTSFGEDNYTIGTFTYLKYGFRHQPTDFYLRPVMVEISGTVHHDIDRRGLIHCCAGRKYASILHEFIRKLMPHMRGGGHFSFFWETQGVHDYYNYARHLDGEYLKLFQQLEYEGILENTIVVFLADHGLRFGTFRFSRQGTIEESLPFLITLYPKWLAEEYSLALSNLHENSHSLTTTFDLHATLMDLSNHKLLRDENIARRSAELHRLGRNIPRGISLFLPIPESRNCQMAGIPAHFCLCGTKQKLSCSHRVAQLVANFVVDSINLLLKNHKLCQKLHLDKLIDAFLISQPSDEKDYEVMVRLQTLPNKGLFEATTRVSGPSLALNGAIARIDRYGLQAHCANDSSIEMYCYCL